MPGCLWGTASARASLLSALPDCPDCDGLSESRQVLATRSGRVQPLHAFSDSEAGALRGFLDRVDGPFLATFSAQDRAVGLWVSEHEPTRQTEHAVLHRLQYEVGRRGCRRLPADRREHPATHGRGAAVQLLPRSYRLNSNAVICRNLSLFSGAHSDICHPEVAWAAVSAAGL
jgi:hypothetical protein